MPGTAGARDGARLASTACSHCVALKKGTGFLPAHEFVSRVRLHCSFSVVQRTRLSSEAGVIFFFLFICNDSVTFHIFSSFSFSFARDVHCFVLPADGGHFLGIFHFNFIRRKRVHRMTRSIALCVSEAHMSATDCRNRIFLMES